MKLHALLKSKITAVLLGIGLLLLLITAVRIFTQKSQVDREVSNLRQRVAEIADRNQQLSDLIEYYRTDEYAQAAARQKLSMQKPEELVVLLPAQPDSTLGQAGRQPSNARKWYDYFFK